MWRWLLLVVSVLTVSAHAGTVDVRVVGSCTAETIHARCLPGSSCESDATAPVRDGRALLDVVAGAFILDAWSPRCWSEHIKYDGAEAVVTIRTFDLAFLEGVSNITDVAKGLQIGVATGESRARDSYDEAPCVVEQQAFRCPVPRSKIDIRLSAPGYAPQYLFGIQASPSSKLDIGRIIFVKGASIAGWVEARKKRSADVVQVTLRNATAGRVASDRADSFVIQSVVANDKGFFQFRNVDPGAYTVVAVASAYAPGRASVEVGAAQEQVLSDPLVLRDLERVDILISPPVQENGSPWVVRLLHQPAGDLYQRAVRNGQASPAGVFASEGLLPEPHVLEITDVTGAVRYRERVDMASQQQLFVTVGSVIVEGSVTAGKQPVVGEIIFASDDGKRATFPLNDEGHFTGVLSVEGVWAVNIRPSRQRGGEIRMGPVAVKRRDGAETATVDLVLPAGRIAGRVINEDGTPATEGGVYVYRGSRIAASQQLREDGSFDVIGLKPEMLGVNAMGREQAESETVQVNLEETKAAENVTLVLQRQRKLRVFLATPTGTPVVGALLRYMRSGSAEIREAVTGPSGTADLRVPGTPTLAIMVNAPGLPKKIHTLQVTRSEEQIVLPTAGATLNLRGLRRAPIYVARGGQLVPVNTLIVPTEGTLPAELRTGMFSAAFEAGAYTVCPSPVLSDQCETQTVPVGASATFDVSRWSK